METDIPEKEYIGEEETDSITAESIPVEVKEEGISVIANIFKSLGTIGLTNFTLKDLEMILYNYITEEAELIMFCFEKFSDIREISRKNKIYLKEYKKTLGPKLTSYFVHNRISQGSFNEVYKIENLATKEYFVLRKSKSAWNFHTIPKWESVLDNLFQAILSIYQKKYMSSKYQNILIPQVYNISLSSQYPFYTYCIMEKLSGNILSLADKKKMTTELFLEILFQICCGLFVLQKKFKFTHHDMKPDNVFYRYKDSSAGLSPDNILVYLGDFGLSRFQIDDNYFFSPSKILIGNNNFKTGSDIAFYLVCCSNKAIFNLERETSLQILKDLDDTLSWDIINWENMYGKPYTYDNFSPEKVLKYLVDKYNFDVSRCETLLGDEFKNLYKHDTSEPEESENYKKYMKYKHKYLNLKSINMSF